MYFIALNAAVKYLYLIEVALLVLFDLIFALLNKVPL